MSAISSADFSHMVMELANFCLIICLEKFSIGVKYFGELTLLQSVIKQSYFELIYIGCGVIPL